MELVVQEAQGVRTRGRQHAGVPRQQTQPRQFVVLRPAALFAVGFAAPVFEQRARHRAGQGGFLRVVQRARQRADQRIERQRRRLRVVQVFINFPQAQGQQAGEVGFDCPLTLTLLTNLWGYGGFRLPRPARNERGEGRPSLPGRAPPLPDPAQ